MAQEKNKQWIGAFILLLAAAVWGFGFVAQDLGTEHVGPLTFQSSRVLLAALTLGAVWLIRDLIRRGKGTYVPMSAEEKKQLLIGGPVCGAVLCVASTLQQFGITNNDTSPGKDAFVTALYIVFVPIIGLVLGRRAKWHVYLCVLIALFGLWLLCMGGSSLSVGDVQLMICSVIFACYITVVGRFSPRVDGIRLSCLQFFTIFLLCVGPALIWERPAWSDIAAAGLAILYSGCVSAAGGYTLQIIGQKYSPPTTASLVMSLESVFAVIASAIMIPDLAPFTAREAIGMVVIFIAIICSQIDFHKIFAKKPPADGEPPQENQTEQS